MGVVLMSKRELNRIDVLARLDGGRLTTSAAADLMRLTTRQTHRLLKRYRDGGAPAIANRRRGQPSNNRLPEVVRDHAVGSWPNVMICGCRGRRCADGCGEPGFGYRGPSASGSSSRVTVVSMSVS